MSYCKCDKPKYSVPGDDYTARCIYCGNPPHSIWEKTNVPQESMAGRRKKWHGQLTK